MTFHKPAKRRKSTLLYVLLVNNNQLGVKKCNAVILNSNFLRPPFKLQLCITFFSDSLVSQLWMIPQASQSFKVNSCKTVQCKTDKRPFFKDQCFHICSSVWCIKNAREYKDIC